MKCTENLPNLTFTRLCLYMNGELKILQPIIIVKRWVGSHCHSLNALEWQFLISVGHQFKEHFQKRTSVFQRLRVRGVWGEHLWSPEQCLEITTLDIVFHVVPLVETKFRRITQPRFTTRKNSIIGYYSGTNTRSNQG